METKYEILLRVAMGILIVIMLWTTYIPAHAKANNKKQTIDIESDFDFIFEHTYTTIGKVTKINHKKGIIYVTEINGNVFSFKEGREFAAFYHKGDIIVLTMYDNDTITEEDDIILRSVNYGKEIL